MPMSLCITPNLIDTRWQFKLPNTEAMGAKNGSFPSISNLFSEACTTSSSQRFETSRVLSRTSTVEGIQLPDVAEQKMSSKWLHRVHTVAFATNRPSLNICKKRSNRNIRRAREIRRSPEEKSESFWKRLPGFIIHQTFPFTNTKCNWIPRARLA